MATKKKMLQAAAGQAGGEALNVEDVFSTYLYEGSSSATTVTNNLDLSGEGGLVWMKSRVNGSDNNHFLVDTERGVGYALRSNQNSDQIQDDGYVTSFNSDGFTLGADEFGINENTIDYASWTFRKAPKFFDVVTYTGDGVAGRTVSHNLGTTVGSIFIKELTQADYRWMVYHRSLGNGGLLRLDSTGAATYNNTAFNSTDPASDLFTLDGGAYVNGSGKEYVAYLFAHNDGDGEFGPDADQDIIKCGSYTGNGSTDGPEINLGWEPQFIITKRTDGTGNWLMFDSMRGIATGGNDTILSPNRSWDETVTVGDYVDLQATGFKLTNTSSTVNESAASYIYIAIRRGPLAQPESATEVFDVTTWTSSGEPKFQTSFASDMAMNRAVSTNFDMRIASRLTQGKFLRTSTTDIEASNANFNFDYMNGFLASGGNSDYYSWQWKRAPGFFDVVAYSGDGVAGRTVSHNLGVAPEMMWVKSRNNTASWVCYHKDIGNTKAIYLNSTNAATTASSGWWNNTTPTDSVFTLGANTTQTSNDYIAYLFASLDGISKVGSYTGNGTSQTIDCGFTSGARFVLIKSATESRSWCVFDTERGIVSGNDPVLYLQATSAEVTSIDWIDPHSSGFTIDTSQGNINGSGQTYIFYAIA